ncbi:hypothetical protein [Janthinobacterium fluminis]|uniref:Bacteriocin-type signal sequence-containing protein n=1 Tax=Janthinobacterium fluminis TaxID=2987524 RepID=A0ABT5JVZ1_9BURK|nr:hypothetical protein [Janthinobacterium fluminis]MDC8756784.1 hypothetical protein [Janthinobacterium fluminis]
MHPFSLNAEQIQQVSGGVVLHTVHLIGNDGEGGGVPPVYLTGGGKHTTLAIGEEGGQPPVLS